MHKTQHALTRALLLANASRRFTNDDISTENVRGRFMRYDVTIHSDEQLRDPFGAFGSDRVMLQIERCEIVRHAYTSPSEKKQWASVMTMDLIGKFSRTRWGTSYFRKAQCWQRERRPATQPHETKNETNPSHSLNPQWKEYIHVASTAVQSRAHHAGRADSRPSPVLPACTQHKLH